MHLVFVRHGPKEEVPGAEDATLPLAVHARDLARGLKLALENRDLVPHIILSSRYRHALETAELLRGKRTRSVIPVTALTPHTAEKDFSMATIVGDAWAAGVDLFDNWQVLMFVGHETRLSQLANRLGSQSALGQLAPFEARVLEIRGTEGERFID